MENSPQQIADEEKSGGPKRRFLRGNFMTDWLWRRNQPLEMEKSEDKEEDSDEVEKKDTKKLRFSERIRRAFQGIFRREVQLDTQPEKAAKQTIEPTEQVESNNSKTVEQVDKNNEEEPKIEPLEDKPAEEINDEGLLPVSKEAIQRYQSKPSTELRSPTEEELRDLINKQSSPAPENLGGVNTSEVAPASKTEVKEVKSELDYVEFKRRRKERRLKNEVRSLKKQAKTTKEEQRLIKEQQAEFKRRLDDQPENIQKILTYNSPELQRVYLKPEVQNETVSSPQPENTQVNDQLKPNRDILPELQKQALKQELLHISPIERPEVVQHKVEAAAEQNIAVESLYERRHEIKDDEPADQAATPAVATPYSIYFSKRLNRYRPPATQATNNIPATQNAKAVAGNMYTQAVKKGFLAGIIICVLLLILLIIH